MDGVLVLDKPAGLSSAGAVDRVKRALGADRAGHGGTLDPIATGVLPIRLGAATKLAQYLLADDKAYEAEGVFGVTTDTLDRTGRVVAERPVAVAEAALRAALARRLGEQDQVPPVFSAIKQDGERLYRRALRGEEIQLQPRRIRIDRLEPSRSSRRGSASPWRAARGRTSAASSPIWARTPAAARTWRSCAARAAAGSGSRTRSRSIGSSSDRRVRGGRSPRRGRGRGAPGAAHGGHGHARRSRCAPSSSGRCARASSSRWPR